ncbi:Glutamate receptor 3.2 [Bienertia sinuspersici]
MVTSSVYYGVLGRHFCSRYSNIGAIFNLGTVSGMVAKIAMNAAVADVNSDPTILHGCTLVLNIHDSHYSGFLSIMGVYGDGYCCYYWPQSSIMAHVLSHLANELHVPLLSFTALDPTLSPIQYPYFFQTAPMTCFR